MKRASLKEINSLLNILNIDKRALKTKEDKYNALVQYTQSHPDLLIINPTLITNLPDEIKLLFFRNLPPIDINNLCNSTNQYRRVCDENFWREIYFRDHPYYKIIINSPPLGTWKYSSIGKFPKFPKIERHSWEIFYNPYDIKSVLNILNGPPNIKFFVEIDNTTIPFYNRLWLGEKSVDNMKRKKFRVISFNQTNNTYNEEDFYIGGPYNTFDNFKDALTKLTNLSYNMLVLYAEFLIYYRLNFTFDPKKGLTESYDKWEEIKSSEIFLMDMEKEYLIEQINITLASGDWQYFYSLAVKNKPTYLQRNGYKIRIVIYISQELSYELLSQTQEGSILIRPFMDGEKVSFDILVNNIFNINRSWVTDINNIKLMGAQNLIAVKSDIGELKLVEVNIK